MWILLWGTRATYGTHTRPSAAPGAAAPGFHFQFEHARVEGKPRRRLFAFTMQEEEGTFDSVSAHLLATAANIIWRAVGPNRIKGGLRRGKWQRD